MTETVRAGGSVDQRLLLEQGGTVPSAPRTLISPAVPITALWTMERGLSPVIATAIHDGHSARPDLEALYALGHEERLREEDPYTEFTIRDVPNRIVFHRSRFEVDINRNRNGAIYLTPQQAWGLNVWQGAPSQQQIDASLRIHDSYYQMLLAFLQGIERQYGRFVVLDIHSYNHRRGGPTAIPTSQERAPDINIGTSSMDRVRWAPIVDALTAHFQSYKIKGRPLDVRENVAFQGRGEQTRFIHEHFPKAGCAVAVEFKKIFMDEWTGEPDMEALDELRRMIAAAVPLIEKTLAGQT